MINLLLYFILLINASVNGLMRSALLMKDTQTKINIWSGLEKIKQNPPKLNYDPLNYLKTYIADDIPKSSSYYQARFKINNGNVISESISDEGKRIILDEGFSRRYINPTIIDENKSVNILREAAIKTAFRFEIGKSKEQQMKDLRKLQLSQRSGVMLLVPQNLHKYIDYFSSLRVPPTKSELLRNLAVSMFFSFLVGMNMNARSSFMYFVVGNLTLLSLLLSRGMPKIKPIPGQPKKQPASWSKNSFRTALAIIVLSALSTSGLISLFLALLPIPNSLKAKGTMIISLVLNSIISGNFEVYEAKGKNGWRWEKSLEGSLPSEAKEKLQDELFGSSDLGEKFDYKYNPQVDDYPSLPKYVDEDKPVTTPGRGDIDEVESQSHFENWKLEKKDARKAPIVDVNSESPWVGAKAGLFVTKLPQWLSISYDRFVKKGSKWRSKPRKYKKDTSEFELIDGPFGFRDKKPSWLDLFGTGVWEEKTTLSRRVARSFGSYRKSMYKIDKKVVLLPCDGADKDSKVKDKKK